MNYVDIAGMKKALWETKKVREKIAKDYQFGETPRDQEHFASMLLGSLKQEVKAVDRPVGNQEVFEAAVRALGSNSRAWSMFISKEHELREVLENYDPVRVMKKDLAALTDTIKTYFPGQTSSNDAQAVIMWAKKLVTYDSFYNDVILKVTEALREKYKQAVPGDVLSDEDLLIFICGFFAKPSPKLLNEYGMNLGPIEDIKFNGMGYVLASEFMRNLGWNGFKPDRHIKRLLTYWFGHKIVNGEKMAILEDLLGSKNKELREFILFSLLGQQVSPKGMKYSEVDNLIWATGAYLIKKGKEAEFPRYVVSG
jgi:hypothetical protein